jgi:hypothetical protein
MGAARLAILHCAYLYLKSVTLSTSFYLIGSRMMSKPATLNHFAIQGDPLQIRR